MAEHGMPEFVIASSTGLLAPSGTPAPVITALERATKEIVLDPAAAKRLVGFGADIDFLDASQYRHYIRTEIEKWSAVGQRARIVLQ